MIHENYQSWLKDLVIIGFDKDSYHISSIPFPAITICLETKARKKQFDLQKFLSKNATVDENTQILDALAQICKPRMLACFLRKESGIKADQIVPILKAIAPYKIFGLCNWMEKYIDCEDLFYETFTDEGICFTFNSISFKEIFKENE